MHHCVAPGQRNEGALRVNCKDGHSGLAFILHGTGALLPLVGVSFLFEFLHTYPLIPGASENRLEILPSSGCGCHGGWFCRDASRNRLRPAVIMHRNEGPNQPVQSHKDFLVHGTRIF